MGVSDLVVVLGGICYHMLSCGMFVMSCVVCFVVKVTHTSK